MCVKAVVRLLKSVLTPTDQRDCPAQSARVVRIPQVGRIASQRRQRDYTGKNVKYG